MGKHVLSHKQIAKRLAQLGQVCRREGLRITNPRLEIFRAMLQADHHVTAEDVYRGVRRRLPRVSMNTVYQTLTLFQRLGLLDLAPAPDGIRRFDPNTSPHHHLVCTVCGQIEDFDWPAFDFQRLPPQIGRWGNIHSRHVELHGLCRHCRGDG